VRLSIEPCDASILVIKVCEYCVTTVLESKLSWDYHSHSYDALKPLPKDRCVFARNYAKTSNK
jgi:hypothetical protein